MLNAEARLSQKRLCIIQQWQICLTGREKQADQCRIIITMDYVYLQTKCDSMPTHSERRAGNGLHQPNLRKACSFVS